MKSFGASFISRGVRRIDAGSLISSCTMTSSRYTTGSEWLVYHPENNTIMRQRSAALPLHKRKKATDKIRYTSKLEIRIEMKDNLSYKKAFVSWPGG